MSKNHAKSEVREEPTVERTPRQVCLLLLQPSVSTGSEREPQKHLRVQISTQIVSLQTLWGYFPDRVVISLCPEATETDTETAKVKKVRWKLCFLQNELGFVTAFSPALATAFSHAAARIYCLMLEMRRQTWRCRDWAVLRGHGVWKYSSWHALCSHNGLAFLPSRKPIPDVSVKFLCKPGAHSPTGAAGQSEVFGIAQV